MARPNRGNDEKTVFFAAKIVFPILLAVIVAAGSDLFSAKRGAGVFFEEAKEACTACRFSSY
jgi:hypothetical protein